MKKISLFIIFLIRVISGIVIFRQGWEKFTGDFTLNGLVPVIRDNTDSPQWYKWFFEHIVAHTTGLFNIIVPLGEMAIGLGLILGIFAYAASFFGAFVSRYDFYVPSTISFLYYFTHEPLFIG